ncbi:IS110 family transposase ISFnu4 [Fusobacterium sp. DD29]|uniref:IS110 family transposase n=1 Tax=Fusobacterium hominis TaxID=2764326 RepID=A0A7G9GWI6_9FUSO|nr:MULTISPECIES: IS110 family transposase [Fusobacterium]MBR8702147.1 IS110 family transposase ISFnu4 [Fusobacterium sp. DD45]MBR8711970.1 IS110 family transposase ISFnu4 [Fusobacterium sp. DD28]MBR8750543.1 IS110 family transposase ISFnu4 [Fusobacterium sp. DD29]MBR8752539.1 IS110 family transposase ISFnu4 [Fusobacterium sp. DD26]MBR8762790.1 IS110 family transposase ISFnu4 [Fusobacterium sp. DD25]
MLLLGVDIAKLNHVASFIDSSSGELIFSNFKFQNNILGFSSLFEKISKFSVSEIIIGLESTGHYGENFINFFFQKGFKIAVINPLQTSHLRKANIRDSKNDRLDSINIAKALLFGKHTYVSQKNLTNFSLKKLTRFRKSLIKQKTKTKIQLVSLLDIIFPELQYFFKSGVHSNAVYTLLKKYPSTEKIAALREKSLFSILNKASKGHYKEQHASQLKSLAKSSVGIKDTSISMHIPQLIQLIEMLDSQIKAIEKEIDSFIDEESPILTIPGINTVAAASILGEINDIENFDSSSKLLAFSGLDPKIRQSGNFNASSCRMSKKGSSYLRYALIFTAWNLVRNSATFNRYYLSKRAQGKSHYSALGHTAHKLVRVIYTLLKKNISYQEDFIS